MHGNQGSVERDCECLRKGYTYKQRPYQTRPLRYGYGIELSQATFPVPQSSLDHAADITKVLPGGQLRYNTTPFTMDLHLRSYNTRQDLPRSRTRFPFNSHRGCGLVTRGFDSEEGCI